MTPVLLRPVFCFGYPLGRLFPVLAAIFVLLTPLRASAMELVMFGKVGCVWCARWEREVGRSYPGAEEGRIAPVRRMDIRDQRQAGIDLQEPVLYTPTFVLSENGVEVGRITGYQSEDNFWGTLDDMLRDGRSRRQ
jgi:hypothetical protein